MLWAHQLHCRRKGEGGAVHLIAFLQAAPCSIGVGSIVESVESGLVYRVLDDIRRESLLCPVFIQTPGKRVACEASVRQLCATTGSDTYVI